METVAERIERIYQTPDAIKQRTRTLEALAPRGGEKVLDVGCGPGLLAREMALLVGSEGLVVGLDSSPDMLSLAEERCGHLSQVELHFGEAEKLGEEDESFDAVTCAQVLLYVADVERALAEMYRVLKPGGRLAIIETDWRGTVLSSSDHALTRQVLDAWDAAVASPNLPVRLRPLLRAAGFAVPRIEAIPILNTSYTRGNFSAGMVQQFAAYAAAHKVIDQKKARWWLQDLQRLDQEGAYFFCVNRFLFSAVRL